MKLIVGLGNPGIQYQNTRHNAGFMVIEQLCKKHNLTLSTNKMTALFTKTKLFNQDVIICEPQTFMNLSGEAVLKIMNYYHIQVDDILIIYDDLDLEVGKIRLRKNGSAGGQNGMKNIIALLKTEKINRIRVGIGKDKFIPIVDYVLGKFTPLQKELLPTALEQSVLAIEAFIQKDFEYAMNWYNKK